jgi:hypothetical protein
MVAGACHPNYGKTRSIKRERIVVQAKKQIPVSKITTAKSVGIVAEAISMSSHSSTTHTHTHTHKTVLGSP